MDQQLMLNSVHHHKYSSYYVCFPARLSEHFIKGNKHQCIIETINKVRGENCIPLDKQGIFIIRLSMVESLVCVPVCF